MHACMCVLTNAKCRNTAIDTRHDVRIQTPDSTLARPTIINIKYPKGIGYPQQSG